VSGAGSAWEESAAVFTGTSLPAVAFDHPALLDTVSDQDLFNWIQAE
jgi:hypothetical protein